MKNANNTIIIKRGNPYKDDNRSGKKAPDRTIRVWRHDDPTTWLKRDRERYK